jgi:hypothetical protein
MFVPSLSWQIDHHACIKVTAVGKEGQFFLNANCIIIAPKRLKFRLSGSARKSQKRFRDTPRFKFQAVLSRTQPFLSRSVEKRGDQSRFKCRKMANYCAIRSNVCLSFRYFCPEHVLKVIFVLSVSWQRKGILFKRRIEGHNPISHRAGLSLLAIRRGRARYRGLVGLRPKIVPPKRCVIGPRVLACAKQAPLLFLSIAFSLCLSRACLAQ